MEIFRPGPEHIPALQQLARSTWEATYSSIISREQIDYMLNLFYDADLMREQMADPAQLFFAAREEDTLLGYAHLHQEQQKALLEQAFAKLKGFVLMK